MCGVELQYGVTPWRMQDQSAYELEIDVEFLGLSWGHSDPNRTSCRSVTM